MITNVTVDLPTASSEALGNSVNCLGGMGRGAGLEFKRKFPGNFNAYKAACDREEVHPGRMFVFETGELIPRYIINFLRSALGAPRAASTTSKRGSSHSSRRSNSATYAPSPFRSADVGSAASTGRSTSSSCRRLCSRLPDVEAVVFEPRSRSASFSDRTERSGAMTPRRAVPIGVSGVIRSGYSHATGYWGAPR